jgi:Cu2+-exporting ATPase
MEFAGWMVIPTLALGGLGLTTMGLSSALAIFHANFGTGIRVAIPTVLLSYLAVAARNGIVVKEGKSLEKLLQVDTVIFEKADRLAAELPRVAEVVCREGLDEKEILAFAAAAHARFASPISRAIVERAREMKLPKVWLDDDDFRLGFGISAVMKGRKVKMGSMSFMERERVEIPTPIRKRVKHSIRHGGSAVLMSINGLFAGGIFLESGGLLEGRAVVEALKKRGKRVILLSEDSERATKILAERLGIDEYHAGKGPHERAALVKSLQSKGKKVAVAGNDPLSPADVLISLKGVSDIAENEADVVLLDGNPLKIEILFQVAEGLDRTIRKCFKIILVPNSLCMFGAVAGLVQHGLALALHSFANLAASINATMPLRYLHATPGGRVK